MRYVFSHSEGHVPRMALPPPGHCAGGQEGLGPERGLQGKVLADGGSGRGRSWAPNPTIGECKNDLLRRMSLWTVSSVILTLFQIRHHPRKLEKISPALEQGVMRPGVPQFPSQGFCLISANAHISPPNTKAHGSSQICCQP